MLTRLFTAVITLTAAGDDSPAYQWARADVGAVDELPRGTLLTQHKISFVDASGVQREPLLTLRVGDDVSARVNTLCARVNTTISPRQRCDARKLLDDIAPAAARDTTRRRANLARTFGDDSWGEVRETTHNYSCTDDKA